MSVEDEKLVGALRSSGDGMKPDSGWQDDVRRTIRNSDTQSSEKRQRVWLRPALISSLCTAMLFTVGGAFFLKNQSDNRVDEHAAEQVEVQATAAAGAAKDIRALTASAQLEADTNAKHELIEKASAAVDAASTWDEDSSDRVVHKAMEEMRSVLQQQERLANAMANAQSESTLQKQKQELTEINNRIAEKALDLLKLKRRMDAHTYHRSDARSVAVKNLKARRAEATRLAEVRKSQAKSAARAKKKTDKKKSNKCAQSSDPLCGL